MCIGREDDKNISSYVDFSILCNFVLRFPELSTEFSKNGIIFTLLYIKIATEWRKILLGV